MGMNQAQAQPVALYRILSVILFLIFSPAGIAMVWMYKTNWSFAAKLLITIAAAIYYTFFVLFFVHLGVR